ncbi:Gfo/Idh/MocA family protein [Flavilitoribacter nigricans]|uniref:Oxidoreductase n=1 Tax=Flavilitoribacter nigricans (strain ATCC 23147 / DSM 23189 / NBRC 102662 / NCIMB 1420 / SS-2) TaxID=1122177 RepID=A0A2D0N8V3_FLAN2|nr:Gfo/Idh/MocA family oxidoreductase [Flavilitoribacter nigricans]PHN04203.1 oxidoreductase [Flavilitoribacter nigricans DSM 23189 = NBRC 102662]
MANKEKIRWGIIGAGDVCEVKSGPALQKIDGSELVAVMRRNGEKAKDFAERHGVPKWYDDADPLIRDPEVDAVYIATPPDTHQHYTLRVAEAGKPIYVEKPMARTHEECLQMVKACATAKVPLFVAYYRRALPNFLKVKEIIDEGLIGEVRSVDIRLIKSLEPDVVSAGQGADNWRVQPDVAGGGYFFDLASHQLDFLDYLFGPISAATGMATNQAGQYPAEDLVMGTFRFENGIMGQGLWCFNSSDASSLDKTTIIGSKGQLTFAYFGDNRVRLAVDGEDEKVFTFDMPLHIQQPLIQQVVDELLGNGECVSTGFSGARTNWVMGELCRRIDA